MVYAELHKAQRRSMSFLDYATFDTKFQAKLILEHRGFTSFALTYNPAVLFAGLRWKCRLKGVWIPMPGRPEGYGFTAREAVLNALACKPVLASGSEESE